MPIDTCLALAPCFDEPVFAGDVMLVDGAIPIRAAMLVDGEIPISGAILIGSVILIESAIPLDGVIPIDGARFDGGRD